MDQRRYLTFVVLSMGIFLVWVNIVAPVFFPGLFPPRNQPPQPGQQAQQAQQAKQAEQVEQVAEPETPEAPAEELPEPKTFPSREILLGEDGFVEGYLVQAQCISRGGAVDWVQLTDPRYTNLRRTAPLRVVGSPVELPNVKGVERVPATLETSLLQIDAQLKPHNLSLATVDWEVVKSTEDSVTFRYPAPDGSLEVIKTFHITRVDPQAGKSLDTDPRGYFVDCEFTIRNLSPEKTIETSYTLQGPVGVPLENAANTRIYRSIQIGTLGDPKRPDKVTSIHLTALALAKQTEKAEQNQNKKVDNWREPIQYAGVDGQFFAALIKPGESQLEDRDGDGTADPYFEIVEPVLLHKADKKERSDVSLTFSSTKLTIAPRKQITHSYQMFCGPKRSDLLEAFSAGPVMNYGWFTAVSKFMLWVLNFFHLTIGLHYALSIIMLTVVVRICMMPITRRQLAQAEKMKVLQPKMKELQDKYKDKPEEFARAWGELQRKHNVRPIMGCLPMFLQLPVLWGLYNALHLAIDLRLAKFLWIDNLAGPDALFQLGFVVPYFGWTEFNLLPLLTVSLFIAQQKLFTPPATTEEQKMQYRMMNGMMIFMGVLFYRMQAGLLIYFITSSLWGLTERQILKKLQPNFADTGTSAGPPSSKPPQKVDVERVPANGKKSWLERLIEAADEAKNTTSSQSSGRDTASPSKKKRSRR